jgi:hypothetical protein
MIAEILIDIVSDEVEEGGEMDIPDALCLLFRAFGHSVEE